MIKKNIPSRKSTLILFGSIQVFSAFANEGMTNAVNEEQLAQSSMETIVVSASRSAELIKQVTRPIATIPEQQLKLTDHAHIQQALNQQPGVNLHRNSGQETLVAIRSPVLTGAGACGEFLVLENGVPLRPIGMCNVNELFEAHHEIAQSIEIMKGPSSEFYGSNALHGAINVITNTNIDKNELAVSVGEHDYAKMVSNVKTAKVYMGLSLLNDGGFRDDSGYAQQKLTLHANQVYGNADVDSYVTVFNLNQETAGFLVGSDSYKDKQRITENDNPEAYRDARGIRLYQKYQWENGLLLTPYLRHSSMEFLQHFLPGQPVEENQQRSAGVQIQQSFDVEFGDITLGLDTELAEISLLQYQDNPTVGSAFLQATIPTGKHYDYTVDSFSAAPFVNIKMDLGDNLALNAGARAEYVEFNYQNQMNTGRTDELGNNCDFGGCRYSRPASGNDYFFHFSPKLSLLYTPLDNSSVYVSLVNGFRTPQATELYRLQREQTVADLEPVQLSGVDLGWRYNVGDTQWEIGAYDYTKKDAIIRNTDFFNVSGAKTRHSGIEASIKHAFTPYFSVELNTTYNKHTYANNPGISGAAIKGLDIDSSPRRLANFLLNYRFDTHSLQLHGNYVGNYYTDVENAHSYPGHSVWHLRYQQQLYSNIDIGIQILNLMDKRYAERADFSSFSGDRYFPGEPRNIKLSIRYRY